MKTAAKVSIFIVEDDAHFRETFVDVMSLRGIEARAAASATEALELLKGFAPSLIVIDAQLPDMHGFDLCRRLRHRADLRETPILLLSAAPQYNDPRDRVEGFLAGASSFLAKPVTMDQLWSEIETLVSPRA
ncbi:MAG TPA: response regulator [Elusimicrobiota bacterium]|jgi:two-component system, OmpR family, phosphate regulon response regulator PhoB|nr:response regulator [Elusimicrobiota bacterium]